MAVQILSSVDSIRAAYKMVMEGKLRKLFLDLPLIYTEPSFHMPPLAWLDLEPDPKISLEFGISN